MTPSYFASPKLQIGGADASPELQKAINQVIVEESLHLPGMFTIVLNNPYTSLSTGDVPWQFASQFEIGKPIKVGFTSSTTDDAEFQTAQTCFILEGEVTAIESHFQKDFNAPIVVRGYDLSHRLHRGRFSRSFVNMTDTDIVNKIMGEVGLGAGTIETTGGPFGYTDDQNGYAFQQNQTNMEFLRERAARHGFELFVQDNKLFFRKPQQGTAIALKWMEDFDSFRVRVSASDQVSSVEVRAWDYSQKKALVSSKSSATATITSTDQGKGADAAAKIAGSPKMVLVNQHCYDQTEADTMAQGLYNELAGEYVYADARAIGNPQIRVGKVVTLQNMGKYNGTYYVTDTRHIFTATNYYTEFSVRGLRGGDLLSILSPQARLKPGQTMLVGIVTDIYDPKKWGRVKVKFPTLTEEHNSYWARIVAPGAGITRGFDCLPEVNDEVLVAFENGDIHRPYIIGGVWNGKDSPPETVVNSVVSQSDQKVRLRTFQTRFGHKLQFVEEDKDAVKNGVYLTTKDAKSVAHHTLSFNNTDQFIEIKTKEAHYIKMDDKEQYLEIKTKGGHYLKMDDKNKKIEFKTSGGHNYTMDDNGKSITMASTGSVAISSASGKNITLDSPAEIQATATAKIKLTVGGSSIEISTTSIKLTAGAGKVEIGPANCKSEGSGSTLDLGPGMATLDGKALTSVKGGIVKLGS